jgi:hypothetical protein
LYMGCGHAAGDKKSKNSELEAGKGKEGSLLMGLWKGQGWCTDVGSVPGLTCPSVENPS